VGIRSFGPVYSRLLLLCSILVRPRAPRSRGPDVGLLARARLTSRQSSSALLWHGIGGHSLSSSQVPESHLGSFSICEGFHTNSAWPASTNSFALDQRKINTSPFRPSTALSASVPRPSTTTSLSKRINTAVSRSGASIMLMFPAVSFRFCSCGGNELRNDDR
jgi:hypothetical protein